MAQQPDELRPLHAALLVCKQGAQHVQHRGAEAHADEALSQRGEVGAAYGAAGAGAELEGVAGGGKGGIKEGGIMGGMGGDGWGGKTRCVGGCGCGATQGRSWWGAGGRGAVDGCEGHGGEVRRAWLWRDSWEQVVGGRRVRGAPQGPRPNPT